MERKVISLWGQPTGEREVSPALVAELEDLLEKARSGEIVGMAAGVIHHDGLGAYRIAGLIGGYSMLGALDMAMEDVRECIR